MRLLISLLVGFAVCQVAILFTTVYLHRALAHRAVALHGSVSFVARTVIWLTTGMKPRQWAAVHRKHHAHTDEPEDPHSPAQVGWLRVQLTNAAMYRRVAVKPETTQRYAKDLKPDKWDKLLFDRAWLGLGTGVVLLCLLLGPVYGIIASVFHMVAYLGLSGAVNAAGHVFGQRPYENSATNQRWLAMLTAGEGWHNNHHALPTSARLGLKTSQTDFGWVFISTLKRVRLAVVRHDRGVLKPTTARTPSPVS
jgi:stearoyl-CoA desaturase (Delta-9 desaturase)